MTVVRASMTDLIEKVRKLIGDPAGANQQFEDADIQQTLDMYRDDVRYEVLMNAPSFVNTVSTNNQPQTIFADYYSRYSWWESDVVIQANDTATSRSWIVLTPTTSDYLVGHWTFEADVFNTGTAPGQYPPVFATGKVHDVFAAAADLLEQWAATLTCAYDFSVDGRSFHRSQMLTAKMTLAQQYRKKAKPRSVKMVRTDVQPQLSTRGVRLLDSDDVMK
jgi:hypothetical protein